MMSIRRDPILSQNIVEYLRETAVRELFKIGTFKRAFPVWRTNIDQILPALNPINVVNIGDHLSEIFQSTGSKGRSQSSLSGGGAGWEALLSWYLNLCLLESRTVVLKYKKDLIPTPVREAITVSYGSFPSNTESDLIAITFPNKSEYVSDKYSISIRDNHGKLISTSNNKGRYNYKPIVDALIDRDFSECEIGIIQCKTNWNDNAQIPMLWDMIYSSDGFDGRQISVGNSVYSIRNIQKFTYSFVTVPTNDDSKIKPGSTSVKRVQNITGGNYWGKPSKSAVASSIKEIFGRNFQSGSNQGLRSNLTTALQKLGDEYSYFELY